MISPRSCTLSGMSPTFVCSIAVIGIFWRGHWTWSRRYGLEDGISSLISWAMLVTILIYIYPLKAIFNSMWDVLSDGRLGQNYGPSTEAQARAVFSSYAIGYSAIAIKIMLLNLRAWQLREPLRLNERERFVTLGAVTEWSVPALIGALSLVLALTLPLRHLGWSGWVYFSVIILVPLHTAVRRRRWRRKQAVS